MNNPADAATALEAALAGAGLGARVHPEGRLALVRADADQLALPATRTEATRLARALGFTHIALLLDDDAAPANTHPPVADPANARG